MEKYDALKLEKQLCFPLYAVSKEIVKKYKPYLDELPEPIALSRNNHSLYLFPLK